MTKIVAYTALHYGRDYLRWAIRSVIDYVDEYVVLYASEGSHGARTDTPCPETKAELYAEARIAAGDKLRWYDGRWEHEGLQRDTIFQVARDADAVIALDYDEVWHPDLIKAATDYIRSNSAPLFPIRYIRVPIIHFYRSFHRAVLHDPAYPYRIIFPYSPPEWGEETMFQDKKPIAHFGYAIKPDLMKYKWLIHGHVSQQRTDIDWFKDRYLNPDARTDLHPVGSEYWNVEEVNPLDWMPAFMKEHPYFNLEVIP